MDDEIKNLPLLRIGLSMSDSNAQIMFMMTKTRFWVGYDEQPLKVLNRQRLVDYTSSGAIAMMSREI